MNKRVKAICCALAVTLSLVIAPTTTKIGPFGVDVVAAATGEGEAAPAAPSSPSKSTTTSTRSTSTSGEILRMLALGSEGNDVKTLQTVLNNNGYKLDVDGFFGPQTAIAVKDYQKQKGLTIDGVVGPNTLAVLIPATAVPKTTVGIGSTGNDVKYLQNNLNKLGYKIDVDGIFGNVTADAVKKFQKENGLDADGYAGPKTFGKLFEKATAPAAVTPVTPVTPAVPTTPTTPTTPVTPPVDTVAAASVVDNEKDFETAISAKGKWIIATTKDLKFDKPIMLAGQFLNGKADSKTGLKALQRKIALYTQDDKRNVTARFTLTAPSLTIMSANASIQHGTFKGDVYVSVSNFQLVDAVVDGNVYFSNQAAKDTFFADDKSKITGKQELKLLPEANVDTVATASVTADSATFEKAISKDGNWIIAALNNLTFNKPLTLDGDFMNKKTPPVQQRKIALYTQDEKHVTTGRFTLTAPKLTINSPMASIQKGTFKGDLYVNASNFSLVDAVIDGNVFFTTQEAADTFKPDATSIITGVKAVVKTTAPVTPPVDTVAAASVVNNGADFEKAISKNGKWIIAALNDITIDKPLVLDGQFKNGKKDAVTGRDALQRKIALYTQDDKRNVTARFTLTAPSLTIMSANASIQHGTFKGDVYVSVSNFQLVDAVVDGNVYFSNQAAKDTFFADDKSKITGKQELKLLPEANVDTVATASVTADKTVFEKAINKDGNWIIAALNNLTYDKPLTLDGDFMNKKTPPVQQRKIALYTQDEKHVTTGRFTLTAPRLTITSPMASIQKGTFKGDLYVNVANFSLVDAVIDGNVFFATQEAMDTFKPDATSIITGVKAVIAK